MDRLEPGYRLDGFVVDGCLHAGGMARIYATHCADPAAQPDFALVMKVPRMMAGDGAENLVGFEVEKQILARLHGPHAPRFVSAGDVAPLPYIVMERIGGETLQAWLERIPAGERPLDEIARIGARIAHAVHALHVQDVCHLDLKPANVMLRDDGSVVLLDFGLSWHAQLPDLLAEGQRATAGSHVWMAPEQVVGVRGDPRSDVFAIGVMLYEMCTGELPFGDPQSQAGVRQRLWQPPRPPREIAARIPPWLQEIVLCCLEPLAANRYESAALLAFDLSHPEQVRITARGEMTRGPGVLRTLGGWLSGAGNDYVPSAPSSRAQARAPIVLAAIPNHDATPAVLDSLRQAAARVLGNRPGARLACVTVVAASMAGAEGEVALHQRMLVWLRDWARQVRASDHPVTCHVLEGDPAQAILAYATSNHVDIIILGAATHGLQLQRFVATVPIKVAMHAPCTVMLVKSAEAVRTPAPAGEFALPFSSVG